MPQLAFGLSTTALVLLVGHWAPWPRKLHRLVAYSYGVASIYLGLFIYLGWGPTFWTLCAFPAIGGVAVGFAYAVDWLLNLRVKANLYDG